MSNPADSAAYRELYSSSDPVHIPRDARMVACHVTGAEQAAAMFPNASVVTVSTDAEDDADVLDAGAVSVWDVRGWLKRQDAYQPTVYCTRRRKRLLRALTWRVPKDWWVTDRTGESHTVKGSTVVQYARTPYFATSLVTDYQWPHRTEPNPDAVTPVTEAPPPPQPRPKPSVAPRLLEDVMNLNHGKHAETLMAMPGGATGIRLSAATSAKLIVDFGTAHAAKVVEVHFGAPVDIPLPRDGRNKRAREVKVMRATEDVNAEVSLAAV